MKIHAVIRSNHPRKYPEWKGLTALKDIDILKQESFNRSEQASRLILRREAESDDSLPKPDCGKVCGGKFLSRKGSEWAFPSGDFLSADCSSLGRANGVFQKNRKRWRDSICAYSKTGAYDKALALCCKMQNEGEGLDNLVVSCVLKACGSLGAVDRGRLVHDQIIKTGFSIDAIAGNTLIYMYAKCGTMQDAQKVFDDLLTPNVASWSTVISGYNQKGDNACALDLFKRMQEEGIIADKAIFLAALKACGHMGNMCEGGILHDQITALHLESDVVVASAIIDMYAKCDHLMEAQNVFDSLQDPDCVAWNTLIAGYVQHGHSHSALEVFQQMQERVKADEYTFSSVLKACGLTEITNQGKILHDLIVKIGFNSHAVVGNALIDMYVRYGFLEDAQQVFDTLSPQNIISWGSIISGYADHGPGHAALELFEKLQQGTVKIDAVIFLGVIKACGCIGAIVQGRMLHDLVIRSRFASDVAVSTTLIDMYANCGSTKEAQKVFDKSTHKTFASWSAVIAGQAQNGQEVLALESFQRMCHEGIKPDKVTFLCLVEACGSLGSIGQGKFLHYQLTRLGLESGMTIESALIDMYLKCGCADEACHIFYRLSDKDLVAWGAFISGLVHSGKWNLARKALFEMRLLGLQPNDAIYSNILIACSREGTLEEGQWHLKQITDTTGIIPVPQHYACLVDLFGRAGRVNEALDLILTMPVPPNIVMWTSLLTSCKTYAKLEQGRQCFDHAVQINPVDASTYMLMSKISSDVLFSQDLLESVTN